MKCPNCLKEIKSNTCPYCGERIIEEEVEEKYHLPKKLIILITISILLIITSFIVPFVSILGIISSIICFYFSMKEEKIKRKLTFVSSIIGILSIIAFFSFMNPYFDRWFSYQRIERELKIDLPNNKAIDYYYENGVKNNNISYTFYKYELSFEEYNKIINDDRMIDISDNDWFITNVSDVRKDYIIYDYNRDEFSKPNNKLDYRYIFIQVTNENNNYYAYVYKVVKRRY